MPFCRKCGASMEVGIRYCGYCGFDNQAQTLIPSDLEMEMGPRAAETMKSAISSTTKTFMFTAIFLGIIFLLMIIIMVKSFP